MNILLIVGDIYPNDLGGAEVYIVEIVKRLSKRHSFHVIVGSDTSSAELFPNSQVYHLDYKKETNRMSLHFIKASLPLCTEIIKKNNIDIIHAKEVFPQGIVGSKLKKQHGLPLVITTQNPNLYKEELVPKTRIPKLVVVWLLKFFVRPKIAKALRHCDWCLAVSKYSARKAADLGASNVEIIPNGVDSLLFSEQGSADRTGKIVTTSTLIPRNGIDTLIKAFAIAKKSAPQATLTIAGDGPLKQDLVSLSKHLGVHPKFLPTVPHHEIPKLLKSSSIFARPSRYEGFGVSFIEAMSCGIPVVACPVGGVLDFIQDKKTGILVPQDDPESLARAILELLHNYELYDSIRSNALKMVRERYSWDSISDNIDKVYDKLMVP